MPLPRLLSVLVLWLPDVEEEGESSDEVGVADVVAML